MYLHVVPRPGHTFRMCFRLQSTPIWVFKKSIKVFPIINIQGTLNYENMLAERLITFLNSATVIWCFGGFAPLITAF